jgi:adenylate cyclase
MALEIERKWLIPSLPEGFDASDGQAIDQGYLTIADGGNETRVRSRAGEYFLTTKSGSGLVRRETSIELTSDQYEQLWPATEGARVTKVRHELSIAKDLTLELDVYTGKLAGLIVAEVEFPDEQTAKEFTAPAWFGADVTSDRAYKNHALAVDGRPERPR